MAQELPLASPMQRICDGIRARFRNKYSNARFAIQEPDENSPELIIEVLVGNKRAGVAFRDSLIRHESVEVNIERGVRELTTHIERQTA